MKFGKEFESQMVPEWHEKYMDYASLKKLLKEIHIFKQKNKPTPPKHHHNGVPRSLSLYRAFSGLTQINRFSPTSQHAAFSDEENQAILVHNVDGGDRLETVFMMTAEEGGEYELVYFRRLDDEFNKVLKFYRTKVDEVMKEADTLNKQMQALIAFRVKVENPNGWSDHSILEETTQLAVETAASRAALLAATPSAARRSKRVPMDVIDEENSLTHLGTSDESVMTLIKMAWR